MSSHMIFLNAGFHVEVMDLKIRIRRCSGSQRIVHGAGSASYFEERTSSLW